MRYPITQRRPKVDRSRVDSEKTFCDILDKVHQISAETVDDTHVFTLSQVYEGLLLSCRRQAAGSAARAMGIALLALALCPGAGRAGPVAWTGGANDTNWFNAANWSPAQVPLDGDDVTIGYGKTVALSNLTASLGSLTLGGTLTFTNWNSLLAATNIDIQGTGVMQHGACNTNAAGGTTNRIWISCSNLTVRTGGRINADGKGFIGATNTGVIQSWGQGPGAGYGSWGASHGGVGAMGQYGGSMFGPYDSETAPALPGSGGGYHNGQLGGAGGGAVWIDASGTVVVNGSITANGEGINNQAGDGAGGSIYISCFTLAGTNGVISANAGEGNATGNSGGGGGGGGRIAVVVNAPAQSNLNLASPLMVTFSANHAYGGIAVGRPGTICLSDVSLFVTNGLAGGQYIIPSFTAWTVTNLQVSGGLAVLTNVDVTVISDLTTVGRGGLEVSNGAVSVSGNVTISADSFSASRWYAKTGADTLIGGTLMVRTGALVWISSTNVPSSFQIGGDLTVTNGGALWIYAGLTNPTYTNAGAFVSVTGNVVVAPASRLYPCSHPKNGGSPLFALQNLSIATTAQFNADGLGFAGTNGSGNGWGYGPGRSLDGGGGSYGGKGGYFNWGSTVVGPTYGSSNAPMDPGSGGGMHNGNASGAGGGVVRIEARDVVTVDGRMSAVGAVATAQGGSGAGGSIFIRCFGLQGIPSGLILADGGAAPGSQGGAGGGGRLAIYYEAYTNFLGTNSAGGGYGPTTNTAGAAGTMCFEHTGGYVGLIVAGQPGAYGNPSPLPYATYGVLPGTWLTNAVEQVTPGPAGVQRYMTRWSLTTNGVEVAGGTATQAVFQVPAYDGVLTWTWTNLYQLAVTSGLHGTASTEVSGYYTNGLQVTITNAADSGYYFSQWSGEVPVSDLTNMPLVVTMDQPRTVQANFGLAGGETKRWAGTGNWMTATNWTPTWPMLPSVLRSHSQTISRRGRPKASRKRPTSPGARGVGI